MPENNRFEHQRYDVVPDSAHYEIVKDAQPCDVDTPEFRAGMSAVGQELRKAHVARVYLMHGTFVGEDALGINRRVAAVFPQMAGALHKIEKSALDKVYRDAGNFAEKYARTFEESINTSSDHHIPVELLNWSSENHHCGRADGAIRLLNQIIAHPVGDNERVLLITHSHGGNVAAIATNLLAADSKTLDTFFRATRAWYRSHWFRLAVEPMWRRVEKWLRDSKQQRPRLDISTCGTPIRYGWDTEGCDHLLHFVNHRPAPELPPYQAAMPATLSDVTDAKYGDFIQHFGIAGTGLPPNFLFWRAALSERRLRSLLQRGLRRRDFFARLKQGLRVHADGTTLLVEYDESHDPDRRKLAGHAVYTRSDWMLFHAERIATHFYRGQLARHDKPSAQETQT